MHHSRQEDFTKFGKTFHYLEEKKDYEDIFQDHNNIVVIVQDVQYVNRHSCHPCKNDNC